MHIIPLFCRYYYRKPKYCKKGKNIMKKAFIILFISTALVFACALSASADDAPDGTVVSTGKEYSVLPAASSAYPDDGKLTDGDFGFLPEGGSGYYTSGEYVGFNSSTLGENGEIVIIIDLGQTINDISAFEIGYLHETNVGVFAPKTVAFAVSDTRNGDYSDIGTLTTGKSVSAQSESFKSVLACDPISGRYVKVTVTALMSYIGDDEVEHNAGWTFIDEIQVYSADASGQNDGSFDDSTDHSPNESGTGDDSADGSSTAEPKTGDESVSIAALAFAAISACAMAIALFSRRKIKE